METIKDNIEKETKAKIIHPWGMMRVELEEQLSLIAKCSVTADTETLEVLRDIEKAKEVFDSTSMRKRPPTLEELGYAKVVIRRVEKEGWVERWAGGHNTTLKGKIELGSSKGQYQWPIKEHKALVKQALAEGKPIPAEVLAEYPDLKATK